MTAARLFVRWLRLAQFRSHPRAELALDGRPVALWGPNGAGKTNVLEAVSLLSPGRGLRRARAEEFARTPGTLGWRVRAEVAGPHGDHDVALTGEPDGRRRVEIDGKAAPQTALGAVAPILWLTPAMDRLWIEGAEGRRRFLDRAALSFEPAHADAAVAYDKAMRERNRLLKDGPSDPRWLDALEARMAEAGLSVARARAAAAARLTAAQHAAKSLFPIAEIAIVGALEQRVAAGAAGGALGLSEAAEIMEEFRLTLARGRREDAAAGRALTGPHRSDLAAVFAAKGVEARLCSTGEQKALLISLVLANARALTDGAAAPVLLLDEVAAHLDAGRRRALYDEICAMGAQAWMTGTGPELFADLGDRAQGFAVREIDGASAIEAAHG
ncbi:MAG: DNA replication/repair protein RecF [Rubrimonas sp.]